MDKLATAYASIGQRVDIQLGTDLWERLLVQHVSESRIYTNVPLEPGWIGSSIGTTVTVRLIQKDGCYFYKTHVEGVSRMDNIQVMVLQPLSEMTRVQRRGFFRVDCTLPVKVEVYDLFDPDKVSLTMNTVTLNISEMGIRFQSEVQIPFNSFFKCIYTVDDEKMERHGRIVVNLPSDSQRGKYYVSAHLVSENETEMQKVRKYLVTLQRTTRSMDDTKWRNGYE